MKHLIKIPGHLPKSFFSNVFDNNIENVFSEVDRMLRSSFSEITSDSEFLNKSLSGGYPKANIYSYPDKVIMELGIPGLTKEDIKIKINQTDGTIGISGKKLNQEGRSDELCLLKELKYSSFSRIFPFNPDSVNLEESSAEFENGILKIEIPRITELKEEDIIKELKIK